MHRNSFFTRDVRKAFSYEALLKYALQMAEALRYMHDEALPGYAVIHRDLKPDNCGFKVRGVFGSWMGWWCLACIVGWGGEGGVGVGGGAPIPAPLTNPHDTHLTQNGRRTGR